MTGPSTLLSDVPLGWYLEPTAYIVLNGAIAAGTSVSLHNELQDPRSDRIVVMKKLMLASTSAHAVSHILSLPPIYLAPQMWRVAFLSRTALSTTFGATAVHFMWIAVLADYQSNMNQDQQGQQRFTKTCIRATAASSLVMLASCLGKVITGKLIWDKLGWAAWFIVLAVCLRGLYSYHMIHKKCMETLRKDVSLRIRKSGKSSQSELSIVSTKDFDVTKVELTEEEEDQREKLSKIRKKIFFLLPIIVAGIIVVTLKFAIGWDFDEVAWKDLSKPYVPDMVAPLVTVALAYCLWYFKMPQAD